MQKSLPAARALVASGPGVFRPFSEPDKPGPAPIDPALGAVSHREGPRWAVVISGVAASVADPGRLGVAVWDGGNDERAGIAAVTHEWIALEDSK